jgi:hypothetical protein
MIVSGPERIPRIDRLVRRLPDQAVDPTRHLFLAAPISFDGLLIQCAGRVIRASAGKDVAEVHDYHDHETPIPHHSSAAYPDIARSASRQGIAQRTAALAASRDPAKDWLHLHYRLRGSGQQPSTTTGHDVAFDLGVQSRTSIPVTPAGRLSPTVRAPAAASTRR